MRVKLLSPIEGYEDEARFEPVMHNSTFVREHVDGSYTAQNYLPEDGPQGRFFGIVLTPKVDICKLLPTSPAMKECWIELCTPCALLRSGKGIIMEQSVISRDTFGIPTAARGHFHFLPGKGWSRCDK